MREVRSAIAAASFERKSGLSFSYSRFGDLLRNLLEVLKKEDDFGHQLLIDIFAVIRGVYEVV